MTGSSIALDTNQAIALLNGGQFLKQWIAGFAFVYMPVPAIGELSYGAENSTRVVENRARIDRLLATTLPLSLTSATADFYARVRVSLKRLGRPIPGNDLWIAAVCLEHDLPLATVDAHFSVVPGLKVLRP
jgi:tRNA(fMet)-specific endonuclease VapC